VTATIADWSVALRLIDAKIDFYGEWLTTGERPGRRPAVSTPRPMRRAARRERVGTRAG
jgi:hypothetical protein